MLFADRRRRDDRFLEWKVRIFSVGAAVAAVGIYLDERWMTGLAIVLLLGGMMLRFLPGGGGRRPGWPDPDEEGDEDPDGEVERGADEGPEGGTGGDPQRGAGGDAERGADRKGMT